MAAARMTSGLVAALIACALVLAIFAPRSAVADSATEATARAHYATGLKLSEAGDHARALVEFEASYRLAPYAGLLFHIAECADRLGRTDEALARYEQYLAAAPRSSRREAVQARVDALRAAKAPPTPTPEPTAPPVAAPAPAPTPTPTAPPIAASAPPAAALTASPPPAPPRRRWVWALVGTSAAVAAIALGVGLGVGLGAQRSDFTPNLPDIGPRAP